MLYKTKNSRTTIPGYTLVPKGEYHQVRRIGLTTKQVRRHPAFGKTRRMAEEMAAVAKLGKLIRDAFSIDEMIRQHPKVINSVLMNILHTDTIYPPGSRIFQHAAFDSLLHFHFNQALPVQQILKPHIMPQLQKETGQLEAVIPAFIPAEAIAPFNNTNYCRIALTLLSIDRNNCTGTSQTKKTTLLPRKQVRVPEMEMTFTLDNEPADLHLLALTVYGYTLDEKAGACSRSTQPGACTIIGVYME